jgi:putative ABC transport system ATP-binding protein
MLLDLLQQSGINMQLAITNCIFIFTKELFMEIAKLEHITRIYTSGDHEQKALDDVNLTLDEGKFIVILGPSGAGKSTLLNLLGGLDSPTSGTITVDGKDISTLSSDELAEYRAYAVGFVFQSYNLIPTLTVYENVSLVKEIAPNALNPEEMLEKVGLSDHMKNFPSQLSGGEQQRVAIARALAKKPKLLLCDEPTGALDYETGKSILKLLAEMSRKNRMTVLIITHNSAIAAMADRVIKLKNGSVVSVELNENPISPDEIEW